MAYQKQNFKNGNPLDAAELNYIEDGIEELANEISQLYEQSTDGGGSSEPDLVIGFDDSNWDGLIEPEQFTFDQTAVVNTYNKLLSGETVNCVLNAIYWPHSGHAIKASSPHVTAFAFSEANNSARLGYMRAYFNLVREYDLYGYWTFCIEFSIMGNGTATISNAWFTATSQFSSLVYPSGG